MKLNYIFLIVVIVLSIFSKSVFSNKEFTGQYENTKLDLQKNNTIPGIINSSVDNFSQLVIGTLSGLGVTVTEEDTQCFKNKQHSLDTFNKGIITISNNIKIFNVTGISFGIVDVGLGLLEIPKVLEECHINQHAHEITLIALQLVSGPQGILALFLKEGVSAIFNGGSLLSDWFGMFNSFMSGDYYHLGKYLGDIINILLKSSS